MEIIRSWLPTELPNTWSPTHGWPASYLLPLAAIFVIAAYLLLDRRVAVSRWSAQADKRSKRALTAILAVAALLAVVNYHDWGLFRYGTYLNEWEVYHHYIGAKYARELGYLDMYGATLAADQATGLKYRPPSRRMRDLRTGGFCDMDEVLARGRQYQKRFSPSRWNEFVADIKWFKAQLPASRWSQVLQDHGYNATPAWSFAVGGLIANHASIREPLARHLMLVLDPLLFLATFACVAWAFGLRTMLLMIIFIGTHYLLSWGHLKGAVLRTDFALCVALAACLIKKGWYKSSGVLLGWAVLTRGFPVFFLVGPAARLLFVWIEERRVDRRLLALLLSCGVAVSAIVLGSLLYFDGVWIWRQWFQKIAQLYLEEQHANIGYQPLVDVELVDGVPEFIQVTRYFAEEPWLLTQHIIMSWGVRALVLLPALYFIKALRDYEALAYGFVFMFFLAAVYYYYYLILIVPLLFFAPQLERPSLAAGLALMFLTGAAGYLFFSGWDPLRDSFLIFRGWKQSFQTYYFSNWMICATALLMVAIAGARTRRASRADR